MKTFTSTHTHPLNIVRVTSSALQKIEKHPHSWTFTSTHTHTPLGHCPYDVIHIPRGGGGDRSRSRTHTLLHRLFYQYHTITKNLKYALVMKHQIYRLKVDGANLGIVGIVRPRPKLLSARLTQTIIRRRHSSCSGLTPALGKPCSLLDRLYFLFFRNI